jgi:iron complex transport system substrate-binding protein
MRKATFMLLLLSGLLIISTSCQPAAAKTAIKTVPDQFPVIIQDAMGQDITISSKPQAIIATNVWSAEILLDLVDTSRIKGLSTWGDDPVLSATADKAKSVAARVKTDEPEGIVALKPDLVIIDSFSDQDGALARTLTDAGAVVLLLASPTDFTQIKQAIAVIAAAVGETEQGQALSGQVDAELQSVQDKLAGLAESQKKKVIYYEDYYDQSGANAGMLAAYGQNSPFDAIAKAAGLINICDAQNYSAISKEKVVGEWMPDILVVPAITYNANFTVVDDQGQSLINAIKADMLLQTLPAVQTGQIYALTEKYRGSTSHYMAKAVVELAAKAYPDLFHS